LIKRVMHSLAATAAIATMGVAAPALAQDEVVGPVTVSGTVGLVSDYRFRGVSLSDEDLALQGGITVTSDVGFYVGAWGSTIEQYAGAETELDLYAGYAREFGPMKLDVGVLGYIYPGGDEVDYVEVYGKVGGSLGPANVLVGVAYDPEQDAIGGDDNWYYTGDASVGIPNTPITLKGHVGYEDGSLAGPDGDKIDWLAGVDVSVLGLTFGAAYVDTDRRNDPLADATAVLSISAAF
jgi:uncharacterized protein (TIGR02001 family)